MAATNQQFPYTFVCEKCGGTFYSKLDPSTWRHTICNKCSGKQYKDYPVEGTTPTYNPKPVPTKPVYNNVPVAPKKEFNLDEYIADLLMVYITLRDKADECGLTIPQENLCAWATGIMIQKGKA